LIGANYGKIQKEYEAIEFLEKIKPKKLIFIIITPLENTTFRDINLPSLKEIEELWKFTKRKLPQTNLYLGCVRPKGEYRYNVDSLALELSFKAIVNPHSDVIKNSNNTQIFVRVLCPTMKIGVSSGSLEVLKRRVVKKDSPTTLYLLVGNKCLNNCAFCIQARNMRKESFMLSRISWPPIELKELEILLSEFNPFKRICLQVTNHIGWKNNITEVINNLKKHNIPISISAPVENLEDVNFLFQKGAERINISIDAAEKELYEKIKEKNWEEKINLIKRSKTKTLPEKITTHIIVGLGEKENKLVELIRDLSNWRVRIALFAFTPLPGTPLENIPQPSYQKYRKIQIITYLLQNHLIDFKDLKFKDDDLILTKTIIEKTYPYFNEIFKTSGCPECNRPYYNESPRITPYNYPRDLTLKEINEIKLLLENGARVI